METVQQPNGNCSVKKLVAVWLLILFTAHIVYEDLTEVYKLWKEDHKDKTEEDK